MSIESTFAQRLEKIMAHLEVNQSGFASQLGYESPEKISRLLRKSKNDKPAMPSFEIVADITNKFEWLNCGWLLTGKGEMILPTHNKDGNAYKDISEFRLSRLNEKSYEELYVKQNFALLDRIRPHQVVKLYNITAVAGFMQIAEEKGEVIDYLDISNLPRCDGGLFVRGDSMRPHMDTGDVALYKVIKNEEDWLFGRIYIISYEMSDGYVQTAIKFLNRTEATDKVRLTSSNEDYNYNEIKKQSIKAIAQVVAVVKVNVFH